MDNLNAGLINELAGNLSSFADRIGKYREINFDKISTNENATLIYMQNSILNFANELSTQSSIRVSDEVQGLLKKTDNLIVDINKTYTDLKEVQKAIDLAYSIVNAGAAVISKNQESITKALANLVSTYNKPHNGFPPSRE